jgi:hypothetical protein
MANIQPVDISSIVEGANTVIQGQAAGAVTLQKNASAQEKVAQNTAELYNTIGQNQIVIDSARQNAELEVQQNRQKAAAALGTDINAQGQLVTTLADDSRKQDATMREAMQRIQEKQSVSFFDDPLGWLSGKLTINDDIQQYNTAATAFDSTQERLQKLQQATSAQALIATQLATPITAASIEASAKVTAAQAQQNANKATIDGYTYNSQGVRDALTADANIQAQRVAVFGAEKAQKQEEIALAHLDMERQRFNFEQAQKTKGEQAEAYYIDQINKGGAIMLGSGYVPIPVGTPKAGLILNMLKSGSPQGKQYEEFFQAAQRSEALGFSSKATSPAHAATQVANGSLKLSDAQDSVRTLFGQAAAIVKADPKLAGAKQPEIDAAMNAAVKQLLLEQSKVIKPGDVDNVYQIPNVRELIASSPTVQQLPLVQKVLAPQIAGGADLSDPSKVFTATYQAIQAGKITSAEAADLATIFHVGVNTNIEAKQFRGLGMVPSYSYNVRLLTNPEDPWGGKEVVDLTKPDQVARALNKAQATAAASRLSRPMGAN